MATNKQGFAGNKSFLPTKTCVACQKPMTWRKSWEKNWEQIKFCSDRCRKQGSTSSKSAGN